MPCSSMVSTITAALYFFARPKMRSALARPAFQVGGVDQAAARERLQGSLHHIRLGRSRSPAGRAPIGASVLTSRRISSASSARSVSATHRSSPWAPLSTCWRASRETPSKSSSRMQLLEFLAALRVQALADQEGRGLLQHGHRLSRRGQAGDAEHGARRLAPAVHLFNQQAQVLGVVPQQPPTTLTWYLSTYSASVSAKGSGSSG